MKKRTILFTFAILLMVALVIALISWFVFPDWRNVTQGAIVLMVGALVMVIGLGEGLKAWQEMLFGKKEAPPPPSPAPSKVNAPNNSGTVQYNEGEGGRNVSTQTYVEHQTVLTAQAERPPSGSAPSRSRALVYVPRGFEKELLNTLRAGGQAGVVGVRGMGGLGKTEMAKHLFGILKDEGRTVIWADLGERPVTDVQRTLADALGISLNECGEDKQLRAERLRAAFAQTDPKPIVFLDNARENFELDLCLPPTPCATFLTSRSRKWRVPLRDMNVMDAEQATALLNSEGLEAVLKAEPEAAKEFIRLCAGHPLALRLAATRLRKRLQDSATPLASFLPALQSRLKSLALKDHAEESLRVNFELSYADLTDEQKAYFRRLAVFSASAGFTPPATSTVWAMPPDEAHAEAREAIEQLEDASLVMPHSDAPGRFELHDLLREYAAEKLNAHPAEATTAHQAHADWLSQLFADYYTDDPSTAAHVTLELDNLREAAGWAMQAKDADRLAQLATQPRNWLSVVFVIYDEWRVWLNTALTLGISEKRLEANCIKALGDVHRDLSELPQARTRYEEALPIYRTIGDKLGEANCIQALGDVFFRLSELPQARTRYEEALPIYRTIGDKLGEANCIKALGELASAEKNYPQAITLLTEAASRYQAIGLRSAEAGAVNSLGNMYEEQHDFEHALEAYTRALSLLPQPEGYLLRNRANIYLKLKQAENVARDLEAAAKIQPENAYLFLRYGELAILKQQPQDSLQHFRATLNLYPRMNGAYFGIGLAHLHLQEPKLALEAYQSGLAVTNAHSDLRDALDELSQLQNSKPELSGLSEIITLLQNWQPTPNNE